MRRWGTLAAITAVLATLLYLMRAPPPPSPSPGVGASTRPRADPRQSSAAANSGRASTAPLAPGEAGGTGAPALQEEEDLPGTVSLRGQVTDERGQPLEGVRVRVWLSNNFQARRPPKAGLRTDAQGRFRFASLTPGLYELKFDRERFLPQKLRSYPLTASPEPLTLQLQRAPTIQGRVVDAAGNPLPKVKVELRRVEWTHSATTDEGNVIQLGRRSEPDIIYEGHTRTGPDGTFVLDAPEEDERRVRAVLEGFTPVERSVTPPDRDVWLVLGRGVPVELTVVDEQDRPVPGAQVDLWGPPDENDPRVAATTDETGQVVLRGVEPGHYTLMAIPPRGQGLRLATTELRVREPGPQRVRLRFEAGAALSGLVVDASGKPLEGVSVEANPVRLDESESSSLKLALSRVNEARNPDSNTTRTGPDGRFTLPHLLPLRYRLFFRKLGYQLLEPRDEDTASFDEEGLNATPGQRALRVVLRYEGRVSGRVVRADGEPLTSFLLDGEPYESPDGTFTEVQRNSVLKVFVPGVGGVRREYESVEGQDVDLGDLVVGDGRPVRVRVVDDASSLPVAGVRLWFKEKPDGRSFHPREFGYQPSAPGGEDSTLLLPDVPLRPFLITARPHGYEPVKVPLAPEQQEVTVRLRAWATLRGQVRVGGQPVPNGRVVFYSPEEGDMGYLRVRQGGFSGSLLPQGRFVAKAHCDDCAEPRPVFLNQVVDVPGPGQTLTLEFDDRRGGATVDMRAFPGTMVLALVPGQHPRPTTLAQLEVALQLSHPEESIPGEERTWRLRNVPPGPHTLLGLYHLKEGGQGFLWQQVQVPPEGQLLLEPQPP